MIVLQYMPYKTIEAAKAANFPTSKEKVDLTLEQINKLAEIFDAIKASGNADNPMAFAWNAWKNVYKKEGDTWVLAKGEQEVFETWLPVAKAEQERYNEDGTTTILTGEALKKHGTSLIGGEIKINHKAMLPGLKVPEMKYEHPFLLMDTTNKNIHALFKSSDATGCSVDLKDYVEEDNKITAFEGGGISILYYPHIPTCTPAMGCFETFKTSSQNPNHDAKSLISRLWIAVKGVTTAIEQTKTKKEDEENRHEMSDNMEMEKIEELAADLATAKVDLVTKTAQFEQLTVTSEDTVEKLKAKTAEFETYKTTHEDELKKANDKIAEFEQKDLDRAKATLASQWETLKKNQIPPGLVHKAEDEEKLREQFETNPHAFIMDLVKYDKTGGTGQEGDEYNAQQDTDLAAIRQLKEETGRA